MGWLLRGLLILSFNSCSTPGSMEKNDFNKVLGDIFSNDLLSQIYQKCYLDLFLDAPYFEGHIVFLFQTMGNDNSAAAETKIVKPFHPQIDKCFKNEVDNKLKEIPISRLSLALEQEESFYFFWPEK